MATLQEWIERYNAKVEWPFERDERFNLYYVPDKGFCEIGMKDDMVFINQLGGDGRFWKNAVDKMAKKLGIHTAGTQCLRKNIKAYIRLFGFRIDREEKLKDGASRYHCTDKKTGNWGLASPTTWDSFFITWGV